MKKIALLILSVFVFSACNTSGGTSDDVFNYNRADFEAAIAAEKNVFLDFFAPWCPTCHANHATLEEVYAEVDLSNTEVFVVDYDNETELKEEFSVTLQSSYIYIPEGDLKSSFMMGPGLIAKDQFLSVFGGELNFQFWPPKE